MNREQEVPKAIIKTTLFETKRKSLYINDCVVFNEIINKYLSNQLTK